MNVWDNELDELVSQPLLVGEGVLDPSPIDSALEVSTGQSGGPHEEALESSI